MEAERKALEPGGVLFRYYTGSAAGRADLFVDVESVDVVLRERP